MRADIINLDEFIKLNKLPEVTSPVYIDTDRHPTKNGIFSYDLFGLPGSYDRKTTFGYIDLHKRFLHPIVYKALIRMNKFYQNIIDGTKYYILTTTGDLVEDNEHGRTGLDFLYEVWDKIKFSHTKSMIRNERVTLFKNLKKDEAFVSKWLVIPPYYRDIDFSNASSGKLAIDEINNFYTKLINITSTMDSNSVFDFMGHLTEAKIQLTLVTIYDYLVKKLDKKSGLIRKSLLGKTIDYSSRSVISSPRVSATKSYKDNKIDYRHTGVPLAQVCTLFFPFIVKEIRDFLNDHFNERPYIYAFKSKDVKNYNSDNMVRINLDKPMQDYSSDDIKKMVELYVKSPEHRFDRLYVNTELGKRPLTLYYTDLKREFTVTDLLYIAASNVIQDKHVWITRYPIETYQNIYPTKIHILTTINTMEMKLSNRYFDSYPTVYLDYPKITELFIDSVQPNNLYLVALGGDYDGDSARR